MRSPYNSSAAWRDLARANMTQNSTATTAPIQSSITSCNDVVRDGTNDWWNSSDAANAAATTKALSAKIVLPAVLNSHANRVFREMSNLPQRGAF